MAIELAQSKTQLLSVRELTDDALATKLNQLNAQKHEIDAELLLYLSEIERRRLYREHSCSSLFEFCVTRLACSEDVAYKRVGAARLLQQFPVIYQLLAKGRIHLTGLMLLKPHLTDDNHEEWLFAACGKSKRQIEKMIATRCPQPDAATSLRKLPEAKAPPPVLCEGSGSAEHSAKSAADLRQANQVPEGVSSANDPTAAGLGELLLGAQVQASAAQLKAPNAAATARLTPLSGHSYRVVFTASERLNQKFARACELLSHVIPPNDLPAVIERALDQLIAREEQRRYGLNKSARASIPQVDPPIATEAGANGTATGQSFGTPGSTVSQDPDPEFGIATKSRSSQGSPETKSRSRHVSTKRKQQSRQFPAKTKRRSRYVAAEVRREVFTRDGGQCTFVDQTGRRCEQRHYLEFDHREAFALGGTATAANLRLRCAAHNSLEAERLFGKKRILDAIAQSTKERRR